MNASARLLLCLVVPSMPLVGCGGETGTSVPHDTGTLGGLGGTQVSSGGSTVGTAGGGSGGTVVRGTTGTGGAGGQGSAAGGTGNAGTAGAGDMPVECQLATGSPELTLTRPQTITFNTVNAQASTQYLYNGPTCTQGLQIYSCADGYQKPLAYTAGCSVSCDSGIAACIACSPCMTYFAPIEPGASATLSWAGAYYTFEAASGCSCHREWTAPAGKYRATFPLYPSNDETSATNTPVLVSVDFTYPDVDGIVTLSQ